MDTETTSTEQFAERPPYFGIVAVALGLYLSSRYSYLLFHSLVEITTIAIGFSIFIITWNSWKFLRNGILTILGIGYAFIAGMDLVHTFAYKGMNILPGFDANLPTELWIAARYLQAVTILIAPILAARVVKRREVCGVYLAITVTLTALIFSGHFPDCFIEGKGLTPFKIVSEYVISLILIVSLYGYHLKRHLFHHTVYTLTAASIACTALAEISFTAYISVYGSANMLGHFAKLASFYLIYRAILVTGFMEPFDLIFRDLKQTEAFLNEARDTLKEEVRARTSQLQSSEKRYRSLIRKVQAAIVVHDGQGRIVECNPLALELLGASTDQIVGTELTSPSWHFLKEDGSVMPVAEYPVSLVLSTGKALNDYMVGICRPERDEAWVLVNAEPDLDDGGAITQVIVSFVDITRLRQSERTLHQLNRELHQSESKLREAQRIGNLGYWDRDFSAGTITLSDEACRIFGIAPMGGSIDLDQWQEQWLSLVHPDDRARVSQGYQDALTGVSHYEMEYRLVRAEGQERTVKSSAEVTRDKSGRPTRMVGTMQDVTEVKQAVELLNRLNEELEVRVKERTTELQDSQQALMNIVEDLNQKTGELETANNRLKELDRLKSMFIASMSHELRTPLNSIIGFSSIIRNGWIGPVSQEQQENLDIINRAGKHLLTLINDVIDVSKIEAGKIDINVDVFDLRELLTEAVQYLEKEIRDKGLQLKLQVEDLRLTTDRRRLMQCIINLLSNAYKFTERGEIAITATVAASDQDRIGISDKTAAGRQILIAVSDTGIGIEEENISAIFKPFVRLESPMKVTVPGTGLGLYLTRKLAVEVLHGTIECYSVAGQGSTFTLCIPEGIDEKGTGSRG